MEYLGGTGMLPHPLAQLQQATGIAAGNDIRLYGSNLRHLAVKQLLCSAGVEQIVNPGTSTTPVTFCDFQQL